MTGESGSPEGGRWLVEPPGSEEISFRIGVGDRVEVTPEIQEAFGRLIQTLRGDDMQGYVYDPKCTTRRLDCVWNGKCSVETQFPCLIDYHCKIAK